MASRIPNLTTHRNNGKQTAIVFVHGFTGHPEITWGQFPKFLAADERLADWDIFGLGYASTLALDVRGIWRGDPELASVADLLRTDAEFLLKDYKSLSLIAHSMGGLVVQRALVDDPTFARRLGHVILFGTPSAGLVKAAWFAFWKSQVGDMAAGSRFITELRQAWTQRVGDNPPFRFRAVAGDQDQFVPRTSSIDPFPLAQRAVVPGNHVEIVKPEQATELSVQLVLNTIIGAAAPAGPGNAARVAVESREFAEAIARLEPNKDKLDSAALVELALALEGVGRRNDAIQVLEDSRGRGSTDAMGVLAGQLKRRWIVERVESDAARALELYHDAFQQARAKSDHPQALYLGINVAFMTLTYMRQRGEARQVAEAVLDHCRQAPPGKWPLATEGEVRLHQGKTDAALDKYQQAVNVRPPPTPRELASMYEQAVVVARHTDNVSAEEGLESIFRGTGS
jgi:pimeloyl-ACP methyl ester carboxylesterase/predicted negative regulator of RcsB-dependent stress response